MGKTFRTTTKRRLA